MGLFRALGFVIMLWALHSYFASSFTALDNAATASFNALEAAATASTQSFNEMPQ